MRTSKDYKFKLEDLNMHVSIEEMSYTYSQIDTPFKNIHYHTMCELFFVDDSPLILHTAEGSKEFRNCILYIPPFFRHSTQRTNGQRLLFTFQKSKGDLSAFMNNFFVIDEPFAFTITQATNFYVKELFEQFNMQNNFCDEVAICLLKLIFLDIYLLNSEQKRRQNKTNESYIVKIDNILSGFKNDINMQTVADTLNLSKKQASRIIKSNYNKTLSELLNEKRLAISAELLCNSNKTILEIVEFVNFSSESYFYAQFKKAYGCTPLKYKKKHLP